MNETLSSYITPSMTYPVKKIMLALESAITFEVKTLCWRKLYNITTNFEQPLLRIKLNKFLMSQQINQALYLRVMSKAWHIFPSRLALIVIIYAWRKLYNLEL